MDGRLAAPARGLLVAIALLSAAGCYRGEAPKTYQLRGQVLSIQPDQQQITVKHEDIDGFMPGMIMSFPVANAGLLKGREPGELIAATLVVVGTTGQLTRIERTGFTALPTDTNAAAMAGNLLEVGDTLPDAALIDQRDRRRALSEWRGFTTMITFTYTRCPLPTYCPLMDRNFASLQKAIISDSSLRARARLITISFDPDFDTPPVLAAHARKLQADPEIWTFLTGDRATVDRFAARLGVGLVRPSGDPDITHNLRTVLVDARGRIARIYSGSEWTPSQALEDLRQ